MQPENDTQHPDSGTHHSAFRPLQMAWKHKAQVCLGAVIGAVLGALYYAQASPVYQSSAKVVVMKKRPDALPMADSHMNYAEDYMATHQGIISSPLIVSAAVREGRLNELESFAGITDPTGKIIEALKISREIRDNQPTNILNIVFRGPIASECAMVVNAVVDSYRRHLDGDFEKASKETARLIAEARDTLQNKLAPTEEKYRKFKQEHPLLWKSKEGMTVIQDRLLSIQAKRSALLVRQSEIESQITLFKKAIDQKRPREELLAMVAYYTGRLNAESGKSALPVEDKLKEKLRELEDKEAELLVDYGKDHPQLKAIQRRIAVIRAQRELDGNEDARPMDPVKFHLNVLEREAEHSQYTAERLAVLLTKEQEEAKELVKHENQDDQYRSEIERNRQLLEIVHKRLNEISLFRPFGGFDSQVISPPSSGWKVGPKPIPVFGVACLLGLLAGFGMAYLAEIADQSFRNPDEIQRQLRLPIVGHIPHFEEKSSAPQNGEATDAPRLDPGLCSALRPKSREAEAYRMVRTSLYFSCRGPGHKIIQVTSPDAGDGKSTLTTNLAVSIAQSGKSVLVIDADFRRPRIHKIFDVTATQGLASVITGQAELSDVIQPSAVPGLSLLPCGPIPVNPAELLSQPQLKELLAVLREKYDFIFLDTPPILAVADPSIVAALADGVLVTVRISKNGRPHAKRAKEILATLGANVLGVVVNGVGQDIEGYGYSKYHYGYSYQSYTYTYSDDEAKQDRRGGGTGGDQGGEASNRPEKSGILSWLFGR